VTGIAGLVYRAKKYYDDAGCDMGRGKHHRADELLSIWNHLVDEVI